MKVSGVFTFISSAKRSSEKYGEKTFVTLCDSEGQCYTFGVREFVEPFRLGDLVKANFNVFRRDNAYIVALETVDIA